MDLTAALAAARADYAAAAAARRKLIGECEGAREGTPLDERVTDLALAVARLERRIAEGAWTRDVTAARRAEWNAWVRANATKKGVPVAAASAQQKRQGWTVDDLRAAIARHGL